MWGAESSTVVLPFVGSKVPLTIDPVIKLLIDVGLGNPGDASSVTTGSLRFVKSIIPLPLDSKEFSMPSLPMSKSILSNIPSSSKSPAHILTLTLVE